MDTHQRSNHITSILLLGAVSIASTLLIWWAAGTDAIYKNYDGPLYIAVAKTWYNKDLLRQTFSFGLPLEYFPAHLPLYPALIAAKTISGANHLQAMILVNLGLSAITSIALYLIASKARWNQPFWIAFSWLFFWPRMWAVRSVGSPETLFILTVIGSLYFFSQKKYWLAGLAGSLAVLTKSPGILLLVTYGVWFIYNFFKTKKWEWKMWPVCTITLTLTGLFYFFYLQTGDFLAYFHTGDNIHLNLLPFRVFDSTQAWVGSFWLEDIMWIYLIGGIGVFRALKKSPVWGIFGMIFFLSLLFVSHRDISRYSLPLVPIVLLGLSDVFEKKEVRWFVTLAVIPMFFYTLNFVLNNTLPIADWAPFL